MGFFKNIGKALGKVTKVALAPAVFITKQTGNVLGHIPVVGKPMRAALNVAATGPLSTASAIANGARVDRAFMTGVKIQAKGIKEVAPYAKMVLSVVPGVGMGVNAAVAAGTALAQGKRIDKALVEGVKGALPGDMQKVFDKGYTMAKLAPSDNRAQMNAVLKKLPPAQQKVFNSAMAVGHGERLQSVMKKAVTSPGTGLKLKAAATTKINSNPVLSAGLLVLTEPLIKQGFEIGIGTFTHDVSPVELEAIKGQLKTPAGQQGFNIAMAIRVGMAAKVAPATMPPREKFGYYAVYGMQTATNAQKTLMLGTVSHDNSARVGVNTAISEMKTGWWPKIVKYVKSFGAKKTA